MCWSWELKSVLTSFPDTRTCMPRHVLGLCMAKYGCTYVHLAFRTPSEAVTKSVTIGQSRVGNVVCSPGHGQNRPKGECCSSSHSWNERVMLALMIIIGARETTTTSHISGNGHRTQYVLPSCISQWSSSFSSPWRIKSVGPCLSTSNFTIEHYEITVSGNRY